MVGSIPMLGDEQLGSLAGLVKDQSSPSPVKICHHAMSLKIWEKIQKCEYVDLTSLLSNDPPVESSLHVNHSQWPNAIATSQPTRPTC